MKKNRILLLLLLLCSFAYAQNVEYETIKEDGVVVQKTKFRTDGRILERNIMISHDVWYEELNTYSDTFLMTSEHFLAGKQFAEYEYLYNDNNLIDRRIEKSGDSIATHTLYAYDNLKRLISEKLFDNGSLSIEILYEYMDNGLLGARIENLSDEGLEMVNGEYYNYDDNSLLISRIQMSGIDTLICHKYSYDYLNRCTQTTVLSGGEIINQVKWEYVKNTRLIKKETSFSDDLIVRQEKYSYNSKGFITKKTIVDYRVFENMPAPKKVVFTYQYTYFKP